MAISGDKAGREPNSGDVQSVVLAIRILETLGAANGSLGVSQIADMLGVTKARVHRHLRTLHRLGSVIQDPKDERYLLGLRPFMMAPGEGMHRAMRAVAREAMHELADRAGFTVVLSARTLHDLLVVDIARSGRGMEIVTSPGEVLAYDNSVQGEIAVATMDPEERARVLGKAVSGARTAHYEEVRERGWASGYAEGEEVSLVAAAISVGPRVPIGTVALIGPGQRLQLDPPTDAIEGLLETAKVIQRELAGPGESATSQRA